MVRLRGKMARKHKNRVDEFQFLYGKIKRVSGGSVTGGAGSFNSYMVRLRVQ